MPETTFEINILDTTLPEHVSNLLQEAGLYTIGELLVQMKTDPDKVFRLQGIGPRAMAEITRLIDSYKQPETATVELPAEGSVIEIVQETTEPVVESVVEAEPASELLAEPVSEETLPVEAAVLEPAAEAIDDDTPFDELFKLKPDIVAPVEYEEEEDDGTDKGDKKGKDKKKKKKSVEVNYDPDTDRMLVRKKHKRGGDFDWE